MLRLARVPDRLGDLPMARDQIPADRVWPMQWWIPHASARAPQTATGQLPEMDDPRGSSAGRVHAKAAASRVGRAK
jgi:hypothetical protein